MRNLCTISVEKSEGKKLLRRPRDKWGILSKGILKERDVGKVQRHALVNTILSLWGP
jgi:hypothetical protein